MSRAGDLHDAWSKLPMASLETIVGSGRALVLAPHPDDESLGCGGLIAECCLRGSDPIVAILTDGSRSHPGSRRYPPAAVAELREREARNAVAELGLKPAALIFLRLPDTAAPTEGDAFEGAVATLVAAARDGGCSTIVAAWGHDPHCDHAAGDLVAREVARRLSLRHVSYPVWGWTLPAETEVAGGLSLGWRLDIAPYLAAKQRAIAAHKSQHGEVIDDDPAGFALPAALTSALGRPYEVFILQEGAQMSGVERSHTAAHFDRLYATSADPWNLRTSQYERAKYATTLAMIPDRRFASGFEVGCSIGELTRLLAPRCDRLLAVDISAAPLAAAREACADQPQVIVEQRAVPAEWPEGRFDLIVFSEVLYFLAKPDLHRTAALAAGALAANGTVLAVSWTGHGDDPMGGREAAEAFAAAVVPALRRDLHFARPGYSIDRFVHGSSG